MYYLYILECADGSLYTGITTDVKRRVGEHNDGAGAKYTRGRGPVVVVYTRRFRNRANASREEARIKSLKKSEKLELISTKS